MKESSDISTKSKVREFWLFKNGVGCANPDYQSLKPDALVIDDFIHVIEFEAYRKAVEALKEISKYTSAYSGASSPEANLAKETLRELGVE